MADALGMIEARSFPAMVEAADAMVKAAKVELVSFEETGGGYVTAVVRGDVAAVKAAVQAGIQNAEKVGELIASHVIARPHANIDLVLPLGRKEQAESELGGAGRRTREERRETDRAPGTGGGDEGGQPQGGHDGGPEVPRRTPPRRGQ